MSGEVIGHLEEKFLYETEASFEWKIEKIFSMSKSVGIYYKSPFFSFLNGSWYLYIYPNGRYYSTKEWISLGVAHSELVANAPVAVGIKDEDGTEKGSLLIHSSSKWGNNYCDMEFVKRSKLLSRESQISHSDVLRITFNIRSLELPPIKVPVKSALSFGVNATSTGKDVRTNYESAAKVMISREAQTESVFDTESKADQLNDINNKAICTLQEHLKDFLLDGDDHDVTFKVMDREFKAHRGMLRARSPVFSAMFKHDMKESTDDPIAVDDCSSEAFGEFLHFVYTGKIENFSHQIALGVYYAADKYDVSGLTEVCVEFLKTSLSTTAICDVITLAAKYGEDELLDLAMTFFFEHAEEVMITKEWKLFRTENPDYAYEMCVKAIKSVKANKN